MYTLKLLQAISDWQIGTPSPSIKAERISELKKHASLLPVQFRTVSELCYRKLDIDGYGLTTLADKYKLPEGAGSWSTSIDVCKSHNDGPPERSLGIGVIFKLEQKLVTNVIINLDALFSDPDFDSYWRTNVGLVHDHSLGISRYENDEHEVDIEVGSLPFGSVVAMGTIGSTWEELAGMAYKEIGVHSPTSQEIMDFIVDARSKGKEAGGNWVESPDVLKRMESLTITTFIRLRNNAKLGIGPKFSSL